MKKSQLFGSLMLALCLAGAVRRLALPRAACAGLIAVAALLAVAAKRRRGRGGEADAIEQRQHPGLPRCA